MKSKKIINIVFYKFDDKGEEKRQACIFYNDGTIENVTYQEGIDACEQIAKELHITSKDAFQEMINNKMIHVMSGSELERRFSNYIATEQEMKEDAIESFEDNKKSPSYKAMEGIGNDEDDIDENTEESMEEHNKANMESSNMPGWNASEEDSSYDNSDDEDKLDDDFINQLDEETDSYNNDALDTDENEEDFDIEEGYDLDDEDLEDDEDYDIEEDYDLEDDEELEDYDEDIEDEIEEDLEEESKKKKGILGFLQKGIEKIKKNRLYRRIILCVTALAVGLGIYSVAAKKTKEGTMFNSNIDNKATVTSTVNSNSVEVSAGKEGELIRGNNDYYNNYSYEQLLEVTENKTQKDSMKNLGDTISNFNGPFADAYVEKDKDIRAALSFDEIVALQHAYNDYNKNEIKAYFNGADINAADMTKNYKTATLQLMGAHVIETRKNPVDMSKLLNDEKSKEFYKKYHEMFLAAKEAKGNDQLTKVNALRQAIRKDFPITQEVRTEGIMHADDYASIESYKLSVVPMIAASEMMFQNLETDNTLNDSEIDFLNDIGLCNYAQDKFEKIQTITLSAEEDNTNPLYEQYRDSIIGMLKDKDQYVTTDEHRDLSKLDAFDKAVNWHFYIDSTGMFTGEVYYSTETHTETRTWTTQHTDYREETTTTEKAITAEEKARIDSEIDQENKAEKEKAEKEAKEKQKEMQKKADKDAKRIKEEVKEDEKDLQNKIEDANSKIDENNKDDDTSNDNQVNEKDFGDHNVDFDDNHSDNQGNLDNSVEDITTDPSGDQTNEPLPDPNETGKDFDNNQSDADNGNNDNANDDSGSGQSSENDNNEASSDGNENSSQQNIIEYEEDVEESPKSNEQLVDEYVENLANSSEENEESYEYSK